MKKTTKTRKMKKRAMQKKNKLSAASLFKWSKRNIIAVLIITIVIVGAAVTIKMKPTSYAETNAFSVISGSKRCLDNHGGNLKDNNPVVLYRCNSNPNSQYWVHDAHKLKIGSFCLGIPNASKRARTVVKLYTCSNSKGQVWVYNSKKKTFVNPNSKLCLDNRGNKTTNRNTIWTYSCNGTPAQTWTLKFRTKVSVPQPQPIPIPDPFPQPVANTSPLPFTKLSKETLKNYDKKVFAHYFTPFPIQINNLPADTDYYAKNFLTINGENGKHAAYGGYIRERPLPQPLGGTNWPLDNMRTEVRRASEAGIDGFVVDILSLSSQNWDRLKQLIQAAYEEDSSFKIMLMPDRDAGAGSAAELGHALAGLAKGQYGSSVYRLDDGRVVLAPYIPEAKTVAYWQAVINTMKDDGINVAFVPCFLNFSANVNAFAPISYGLSYWGNRFPAGNSLAGIKSLINDAHTRGKVWMQPVSVQDERPRSSSYWEANNSENLRATWEGAFNGADWVQIPTWNDYSESAEIAPSTHVGWSLLDINAYYITKYKTGSAPIIDKDVLYVSHCIQRANALPSTTYPNLQVLKGSTPARDKVEVLAFLKQAATLEVKVGDTTTNISAPAGFSVHVLDLKLGTISVKATVDGSTTASVTSPFEVVQAPLVQDLQYHYVSSSRGNNGIGSYNDSMAETK